MTARRRVSWLLGAVVLASCALPSRAAADDLPPAVLDSAREILAASGDVRARLIAERAEAGGADLVRALSDAGGDRRRTNDLTGALDAFEAARDTADRAGLAREGANARREMAHVLSVFGRYAESRAYVEQARLTYRALGDTRLEARSIINLGILARYSGDLDGALARYADARQRAESLGDQRLIAIVLNNTGVIHLSRGDLGSALEALEDGLARVAGAEDDQLTADLLGNLGAVHFAQVNLELALDYLRRSVAVQERLGNDFGAIHERVESGGVLSVMGRVDEARTVLEQAAAQAEKAGAAQPAAFAREYLTKTWLEQGQPAAAEQEARRAVALARTANADALMPNLCLLARALVRNGKAAEALRIADEAVALGERMDSDRHRSDAWDARGEILAALGRDTEAAEAFERSIRAVEAQRNRVAGAEAERQRFLERRTSAYEHLMRLHARNGRAEEALAQSERGRARALVDALRGGRTRLDSLLTPAERERQASLLENMARAGARVQRAEEAADPAPVEEARTALRDARGQYEGFRSTVFASHPDLQARTGQVAGWDLNDARGLLHGKTLALSYSVTDDETYLFVLSRSGPVRLATLPLGTRALAERTRRFRESLAARELGVRTQARALCADLLGPVRKDLGTYDRLLLVPDGPLWELPFQALECRPGRYLLEDHAIAYAPSFTALREMSRRQARHEATEELLALGDPLVDEGQRKQVASQFRGASLGPLPEAAAEVRALGKLYGPDSVVYVGEDAREARVKAEAGRHRLLHFAAHGLLNDASPLYSQLVLAKPAAGEADDGLLEAWEIMEMDLHADVAVLSSCDSGRGRQGRGEGLIGLSWAFSVAGCPTTVVSQWKVDSRSTSKLMLDFHGGLTGGRAAADALRAAALRVKADRRYAHPFYWAGFIVVGPGLDAAASPAASRLTAPAAVR